MRSPERVFMVLALGCAGAPAFACGDSSTPSTEAAPDSGLEAESTEASAEASASDGGATCELPSSFGSTKCNECVAENCCDSVSDCTSDSSCKPLLECILGCLDEPDAGACVDDCKAQHPDPGANAKWNTIETCGYFSDPCAFHCSTQY